MAAWYEIDYRDQDSLVETIVSIIRWTGSALALTILTLGSVEVVMVLAARYRARRYEEARQEGLKQGREAGREEGREEGREAGRELNAQWTEWLKRRDEARANNQPFDEPSPAERESNSS